MELEVFAVSIIYWMSLLGVALLIHRRLSALRQKLASLEAGGKTGED